MGATPIEYGLVAARIAVAITAMGRIGTKFGSTFNTVSGKLVARLPSVTVCFGGGGATCRPRRW